MSPYMSSSVKLHIVVALDQSTRLKEGLDWLLGRHHVQVAASTSATAPSSCKAAGSVTRDMLVKTEVGSETSAADVTDDLQSHHLTGYQRILNIMTAKQVTIEHSVRHTFSSTA